MVSYDEREYIVLKFSLIYKRPHPSSMVGWCEPILVAAMTNMKLLLRVWIKVMDERQISLDYVRGSNIYVRGYLDLRTWSLRLRT